MEKTDYDLKSLFKNYGGATRVFKSLDFIFALGCAILFFCYIKWLNKNDPGNFAKNLAVDLLNVSASLFAILFAAFAIILSLSDEKFVKFLTKLKVLDKILFPFWLVSILYVINIMLNVIVKFLSPDVAKYVMILSILTFSWAIFGTIYLINDTVFFGMRRADYLEYEKEIKEVTKNK